MSSPVTAIDMICIAYHLTNIRDNFARFRYIKMSLIYIYPLFTLILINIMLRDVSRLEKFYQYLLLIRKGKSDDKFKFAYTDLLLKLLMRNEFSSNIFCHVA